MNCTRVLVLLKFLGGQEGEEEDGDKGEGTSGTDCGEGGGARGCGRDDKAGTSAIDCEEHEVEPTGSKWRDGEWEVSEPTCTEETGKAGPDGVDSILGNFTGALTWKSWLGRGAKPRDELLRAHAFWGSRI